ncbi:Riboflavin transporter [Aliiroseovarius pelagivivens]|uniref:Riboflavin transporter n=1 Tax=Aliiroseovarius pelagivivens TaxID=1639690 RepID=A0A2R8AH76_9RHOB|nr:DMT family transporter [Aliiroseovarius pelagivivens]SPF75194.1 Riboflavin transporter [Aliiroseovarius pelagivivens]
METRNSPLAAVGFMLVATVFIAGTTLMAKLAGKDLLGEPLHPFQITHGRFTFAFLAIGTFALIRRLRITRPNLKLHVARSAAGFTGVTLMFAAATLIPLADATAISFLNPVFAMLLAIPLLGERVGPWRWLSVAMALVGALILIRPGASSFDPAAMLALGAAALLGLETIFIKRLAGREAPLQILVINNAIGLVIASCAVLFVWQSPTPAQWGVLAALGFMMASAQACYVQAIRRADASFVVPFSYATLIFAALYDFGLFGVTPGWVSALGAGIIVAGGAILAWREGRQAK